MRKILASDLMNSDVLTVDKRLSVVELAAFLTENEISGAPVVNARGRLVGVVSAVDIAASASEESDDAGDETNPDFYLRDLEGSYSEEEIRDLHIESEGLTVADIMTDTVHSVAEDATVSEVASAMLEHHIHRLLVTRGEKLLGIISTTDLLGLLVDEE